MPKIKIVLPFKTRLFDEVTEKTAKKYASRDTEIVCVHIKRGPESIQDHYDDVFAAPGVMEEVEIAEKEGYDGVIISCFGDTGLKAARERANIPVVGTAESSMLLASALGQRFSVITILLSGVPMVQDHAKVLGVFDKIASIRTINVSVDRMPEVRESGMQINILYEQLERAVESDGAHVVVLGGTCMAGVAPQLHKMLKEKKGYDVPVIDPVGAPVKFAECLISLGLTQSKLTYMTPAEKERN